ncbi:MAG TPA: hypothetical protein VH208_06865, partial [Myxococcaceae bacterium]|nr:hypothetical protein [Myxococcaceae bacterium]
MSRFHCFTALLAAACLAAGCSSNGGGQGGCPSGQIFCGSVCATLGSDPQNCGACGAACGTGQACVGGVCAASCGTGATSCRNDGGLLVCV